MRGMAAPTPTSPTTSHWGAYGVRSGPSGLEVVPHPADPSPSPLLANIPGALWHPTRVANPAVRRGWLERGPGPDPRRGREEFVELGWDEVLDRLAAELDRVRTAHGNAAIFGGSYGWASAGRFHHAKSQLHRFLNAIGGFTDARNTYSVGASQVLLPHLLGDVEAVHGATSWPTVTANTELLVAFGGVPAKNVHVTPGGVTRHDVPGHLDALAAAGVRVALVSPLRADLPPGPAARWYPVRPGTDVALMLGLAHTLLAEGLHDAGFLARCTAGHETFERYLLGAADGTPKDAAWAAAICAVPAADIVALAREMAAARTLVTVTWSLQRAEHGEQPVWAGLALAALLGQIGLPGGGFGHGYGSMGDVGSVGPLLPAPGLPPGRNPVATFIPVARIADLLLHPGEEYDYDGARLRYPDIRCVYWAGGNPFHHHQDLNRLRRAFTRPDTVVVHEPYWTATARHADVVLPVTTTLEREDLGCGRRDTHLVAMHRAVPPYAGARDDHEILAGLAGRLGVAAEFTAGRDVRGWLEHLYDRWRARLPDPAVPDFAAFWAAGEYELPPGPEHYTLLERFRADPVAAPLRTPSGRIEITSARVVSFGYPDCPGHPVWLEPAEWLGGGGAARHPLHLLANQPDTRLHSQLDVGALSQGAKVAGREPVRLHPADAAARGIAAGDIVRIFNDRGACLAGAVLTDAQLPGVVQLATGAWFDPVPDGHPDAPLCAHGNPNVLTADVPTSRLTQGCAGAHALVEVERYAGKPPPVTVLAPPPITRSPVA